MKKASFLYTISILFIIFFTASTEKIYSQGKSKPFTIVIDPGHGGHDSGAKGRFSKEKDINLSVTLLLGKMIEENHPDVKVVYTRKSDYFITLQERADCANRNNADIFFSIHSNANNNPMAFGAETYTLGLHRTQSNLDVAMRENAVMTLEDDYKTKYQGFDPRSVDSYIMFEFMQDKYIDKSIGIASAIQKQFKYSNRLDRGVRQAGFWVLHKSACPSVLIELGFMSNRLEEQYLNSVSGQRELSTAIYKAFVQYKRDYDRKSGKAVQNVKDDPKITETAPEPEKDTVISANIPVENQPKTTETKSAVQKPDIKPEKQSTVIQETPKPAVTSAPQAIKSNENKVIFKIQLFALNRKLRNNAPEFKRLSNVTHYVENGFYKYTYGEETDYEKINKLRKEISGKFPNAYVIAFKNGEKIAIKQAVK